MNTINVKSIAINNAVVSIQQCFNGMLEGMSADAIKVASYYNTLSIQGKVLFTSCLDVFDAYCIEEDAEVVASRVKTRKLRKQISVVHKRVKKTRKAQRATKIIFDIKEELINKASSLLRRVGVKPTNTPIEELLNIPVETAGFLFNSQELCNSLKVVMKGLVNFCQA